MAATDLPLAPLQWPFTQGGRELHQETPCVTVAVLQHKDYYVLSRISQCGHMELVIIVATITAFFSHFLIEKGVVANTVSVIIATLISWALVRVQANNLAQVSITDISFTAVTALFISLIVGLVFAQHKKCSK
jgi:hypothetical protein